MMSRTGPGITTYLPRSFHNEVTNRILSAIKSGKNIQLVGPVGSGKSFYLRSLAHHYPHIRYIDLNLIPEKTSSSIIYFLSSFFDLPPDKKTVIAFDSLDLLASANLKDVHNWLLSQFNLHRHHLSYIFAVDLPLTSHLQLSVFHDLDQILCEKYVYLSSLNHDDALWFVDDCLAHIGKKLTLPQKENLIRLSGGYMQTLKRLIEAEDDFTHDIHLNYHLEKLYRSLKPVLTDLDLLFKFGITNQTGQFKNLILSDFIRNKTASPQLPFADRLTSAELKAYRYLNDHTGQLCSREDLIAAIWGSSQYPEVSNHALDQLIHRLKTKLAEYSSQITIQTVRGRGHRLITS